MLTRCLNLALVTLSDSLIMSFCLKETEKIWNGERVAKLPMEVLQEEFLIPEYYSLQTLKGYWNS